MSGPVQVRTILGVPPNCGEAQVSILPSPPQSWNYGVRLLLRHRKTGPSHGRVRRAVRTIEKDGSPTCCFYGQIRGRRQAVAPLPGCTGVLIEMPFRKNVSVESHLSRIFPAYPRSLARCLSLALRHVDVLLPLRRPAGLGFQTKISPKVQTRFFFGASAESTSRPWERGTSRHFVQECPEGNPGKYKQEK